VGNFPGVTIEKHEGYLDYRDYRITVVDLPGTYSLTPYSPEEIVTRRFIIDEKPDVVVNVVEGTNLERNLMLTVQLMEMEVDLLVALNMMDEVEEKGISIDLDQLERLFGSHIVPISARNRKGLDDLLDHIVSVSEGRIEIRKNKITFSAEVEKAIDKIADLLSHERELDAAANHRWLAIKLLENDREVYTQVQKYPVWVKIELALQEAITECGILHSTDPEALITEDRHAFVRGAMQECVRLPNATRASVSDYIDSVVLNRVLGLPIFFLVVWAIFQLTFTLGKPLMEALAYAFGLLSETVAPHLPAGMMRSIFVDGVISGVGSVVVFLPNIVLLFMGLSFLEASGYMARAAFVIDKVMHRFGLHGKSFIPMITGFGCSIPAIMATRTLKSRSDRLATIMTIPFMSCGAKLMYLKKAGTLILGAVIVIWAASNFPRSSAFDAELAQEKAKIEASAAAPGLKAEQLQKLEARIEASQLEYSLAGRSGKLLEPLIRPLGFDWRIGISLVTGLAAKEVVVSTLGTIFSIGHAAGETSLSQILRSEPGFTKATALSLMVFVLLYIPCVASVGVMKKEVGAWKPVLLYSAYVLAVAWIASFITYRLALLWM
jgi:Fe2+ transport system protein B